MALVWFDVGLTIMIWWEASTQLRAFWGRHPPCLAYGFHQSRPAGTRVMSHPFKPIQNGTNKGRTQLWRVKLQSTYCIHHQHDPQSVRFLWRFWVGWNFASEKNPQNLWETVDSDFESKSCALQRESSRYPTRAVGTGRSVIDGLNPRKTPRISGFPTKRLPVNEH